MISFSTVLERALTGPICSERDFDLRILVPSLRKVIEKHGIKYDPQNPVPADDSLADRVWEAGVELLLETGIYCLDAERRILFSKNEIEGALETGPQGISFGEGKDTKVMPRRFPEDKTPPWCSGGGCRVTSEQILINVVKTYAENPLANGICSPCLTYIDGQYLIAGSPLAVEGAIRTVILTREALRRAGRPGMPIVNGVSSAVQAQEHIAGHHFGIRTTDVLEASTVHEMKVNFDSLNKVAYSLAAGNLIFAENGVILGGLAGGPAGAAVVTTAYNLVDLLVLRGAVQHPFLVHFDLGTTSARDTIWAQSLATQAITRNSTLPTVSPGYVVAGMATKMSFYEYSAWIIGTVVSGGSVEVGAPAKNTVLDVGGPMEPIFGSGIAHAVAGMNRKEVNRIVLSLLDKYEGRLHNPPGGRRYQECFDVSTGEPNKEFIEVYREVINELINDFGLRFPAALPYI